MPPNWRILKSRYISDLYQLKSTFINVYCCKGINIQWLILWFCVLRKFKLNSAFQFYNLGLLEQNKVVFPINTDARGSLVIFSPPKCFFLSPKLIYGLFVCCWQPVWVTSCSEKIAGGAPTNGSIFSKLPVIWTVCQSWINYPYINVYYETEKFWIGKNIARAPLDYG